MKSYGRAPTFLLATGHEQVRSIMAEIAGDHEAARRVELVLPETGVCSATPGGATKAASSCCGGPAPAAVEACCTADAQAKAAGAEGCGCGTGRQSRGRGSLMSSIPLASPAPTGTQGMPLILALGVTQVIGYGALYYAFAVLAPAMTASFGWSPEWTYGGFAVGLLAGGFAAPVAGRLIDLYGTRLVMSVGSGLAGLALLALAEARGPVGYFAAMIALEIVSTMVLYDAAFAALTQARGAGARRAISQLTLIGGFASTLFWPLTTMLLGQLDWREIYRIYAVLQFALCVPLHLFLLPGRVRRPIVSPSPAGTAERGARWLSRGRRTALRLCAAGAGLLAAGLRRLGHVGAYADDAAGARPERRPRSRASGRWSGPRKWPDGWSRCCSARRSSP